MELSVVIITKNEAHIIGRILETVKGLTGDIVIVDSGSTDTTREIARRYGVQVIEPGWNGYGPNKNIGIKAARYDWILNLDADEALDDTLQKAIHELPGTSSNEVFVMRFRNYYMEKWIRFGEWGSDKHIRLFNRRQVQWNEAAVHENLLLPEDVKLTTLPGNILHYTVHSREEYEQKTIAYARLNAEKYFQQGRKANPLKQFFSPLFSFIHNYIIRLGFLDGAEGLLIARTTARYTYLKYKFLGALNRSRQNQQP